MGVPEMQAFWDDMLARAQADTLDKAQTRPAPIADA